MALEWLPMSKIPEEQKDGRQVLLWANGLVTVGRYRSLAGPSAARWYIDLLISGGRAVEITPLLWAGVDYPQMRR